MKHQKQRQAFVAALKRRAMTLTDAALEIGINRRTLQRWLRDGTGSAGLAEVCAAWAEVSED